MTTKYQIFISSTYEDLKFEREQVIKAVLEMGHIPVGMEMFSAADDEQWKIITRQIDEADYYAVIVAHRYGAVTSDGISYTEKEYDYAVSIGVPILGFVLNPKTSWPADMIETDSEKKTSLEVFAKKVKSRIVNFWDSKEDLYAKFSIALMKSISTNPRTGWIKSSEAAGPELMKELSRLSSENARLREQIEKYKVMDSQKETDEYKDTVRTLSINKKSYYIFKKQATDWEKLDDISLLTIFEAIAPNLMVENKTKKIAEDIALETTSNFRTPWPIPSNFLSHWLADLASLDLIEPSKKKHSVNDVGEYWSLSKYGKKVHNSLRKLRLQVGITEKEEAPTDRNS